MSNRLFQIVRNANKTVQKTALLFLGGASAGLIVFFLFGGVWQVSHFWWVMAVTSVACGFFAVVFRQSFEKIFSALMDNFPSGL